MSGYEAQKVNFKRISVFQLCGCQDGGCEFYEVLWRDAVFQNTRRHILDDVLYFYFQAQIVAENRINII